MLDGRNRRSFARHSMIGIGVALTMAGGLTPWQGARAYQFEVRYAFCADSSVTACRDGAAPMGVIMDKFGTLYGLTLGGGNHDIGAVFEMVPKEAGWAEKVLYSFCPKPGCADGDFVAGLSDVGLVMDGSGNLYGTTSNGGDTDGDGTVFELTRGAKGWTEKVLHTFCSAAKCADGANPYAGLIIDASGRLYGTTAWQGAHNAGVVFELSPNASKTAWTETVLHNFCNETSCADGKNPEAPLIADRSGNLYGTTLMGGAHNRGTVFELMRNPATHKWTEKVIHAFCIDTSCSDGANPEAGLIIDGAGDLYGTTAYGGTNDGGAGTVFKLVLSATTGKWTETVTYNFCARPKCADGEWPMMGVIMDKSGHLYGTTYGPYGGTVFELTPDATKTVWIETVLHTFCTDTDCIDGHDPTGTGLFLEKTGSLIGTTFTGGVHTTGGTVFELVK